MPEDTRVSIYFITVNRPFNIEKEGKKRKRKSTGNGKLLAKFRCTRMQAEKKSAETKLPSVIETDRRPLEFPLRGIDKNMSAACGLRILISRSRINTAAVSRDSDLASMKYLACRIFLTNSRPTGTDVPRRFLFFP